MPTYRLPRLRRPVAMACALLLGWALLLFGSPAAAWAYPASDVVAPELTLPSDVAFVVGRPGDSYLIEADGDPVPSVGVDQLPRGLTLVPHGDGTATIAGTPTGPAGVSTVAVLAQSASGVTRTSLLVTVQQAPAFVDGAPLVFPVGQLTDVRVRTVGFPAPSIGLDGDLPVGLTFVDHEDGTASIVGTPVEPASVPVTLTAVNVVADASRTMTISVLSPTDQVDVLTSSTPSAGPR